MRGRSVTEVIGWYHDGELYCPDCHRAEVPEPDPEDMDQDPDGDPVFLEYSWVEDGRCCFACRAVWVESDGDWVSFEDVSNGCYYRRARCRCPRRPTPPPPAPTARTRRVTSTA